MTQIHFKHLALRGQTAATEKVRAIMSLRRQREEEDHEGGACWGKLPWLRPSGYVKVRWRTVRVRSSRKFSGLYSEHERLTVET